MSMDNDLYIAPLNMAGHSSTVIDHEITQKPLLHCYSFDLNNQNHIINGIPMLSGEQCEPISNVHVGSFMNSSSIGDTNSFLTSQQGKNIVGEASNHIGNSEFHEHLAGGTSSTPASLAAILAARIGLQENLENSANLSPSLGPFEALGSYVFNNWQDNSNPLSANFSDRGGYNESGNGKWNVVNKFLKAPEVDGAGFLPYSSIGNIDHDGWTSLSVANLANHAYNSSNYSNELSLSLATSPTAGQCSEMSGSDVSCSMNETRTGLEKASCSSSRELSMNLGSDKHVRFSPSILGSKYLVGIQEILAQIAAYSFENLEEVNFSAAGARAGVNKSTSAFTSKRRVAANQSENSSFEDHSESPSQKHAAESNKSQLLTLLQLVDDRYSQCLDEIHTVVSAFHAATELDPHIHAHFALRTISLLYKDLRERISSHILAMGSNFNESCSEEKEWAFDTSFIQKQWALQQLKRKDQLWRPQRGLPERSVSVLRAWMFQNFLHPYPKDAEKHLLAVKSGLTRSQVSNWFINARVRLWKPMIEEMYAEMNRRKACRNEEGIESSHRSRICLNNQMFNMN